MVRENYTKVRLGDICNLVGGYAFKSASMQRERGLYQIVKMANLYQGKLDIERSPAFLNEISAIENKYVLKKGDVLITLTGTIGKRDYGYSVLINDENNLLLNQRVCALRPKSAFLINSYYLSCIVKANDFLELFYDISAGGTGNQTNVSIAALKEIEILLPHKSIQDEFERILTTWDSVIEYTERLVEAKLKVKEGLAQKLFFGKARLGGRSAAGISEKRWFQVPNDWVILKIGAIAKEVNARNLNGEEIPVLSCTKHHGLVDSLTYFDKQIFSKDTSTYKVVEFGQFVYATNHIEEGSIGHQDLYPKGLVSPMYTVFETDPKYVNNGFLYKLLKTETFRRIFAINTNASVDRRGGLRWQDFAKLVVPLPTLDEQAEIDEVLGTAQCEIDLLTKELALLKKQKRGLMQKLLTGEWRLKTAQEVT